MHLRIDGIAPGDLETTVAVVALPAPGADLALPAAGADLALPASGAVGALPAPGADLALPAAGGLSREANLVAWVPTGEVDRTASLREDPSEGWPVVATFAAAQRTEGHFAWGAELEPTQGGDDQDMAERVATWTALIDAGARVVITSHVAEARRVAVMASDLLTLRAARSAR